MAVLLYLVQKPRPQEKPATEASRVASSFVERAGESAVPVEAVGLEVRTNDFRWVQLESEDYRTYIERLRSIGCPEQTIKDIIIADLDKLMAGQMREIEAVKEPPKYWKPENKELINTQAALEKLERKQELDFEKRKVVAELLGVDLAAERLRQKGERDIYAERLSFLPEEKLARVRMIMEEANKEEMRIRENSWLDGEGLTVAEKLKLEEIESAKEKQVARVLSPEEYRKFELWFSPSAYKVRQSFFTMEPTEEEFLSVYRLQKNFDEQWQETDLEDLGLKPFYEAAERELELQVQEALGAERYAELVRVRDADYRELQVTAAQFNLPRQLVEEVQGYRQVLEAQRREVMSDPGLSAPQRAELLRAFAEEAELHVVETLGPKAYRYYVNSAGGKWIFE